MTGERAPLLGSDLQLKWPEPDNGKINIHYTKEAWCKSVQLVNSFNTEIAWHYLVRRTKDGFFVFDVLVYPQTVTGASVRTDMTEYADWKINLSETEDSYLFGQAHSHVNMPTDPSGYSEHSDLRHQMDEIALKGKQGYYLFQIWNKKLDINTFMYDLDNNVLYEQDDVNLIVDYDEETSEEFLDRAKSMLKSPGYSEISNYYQERLDRFLPLQPEEEEDEWDGFEKVQSESD